MNARERIAARKRRFRVRHSSISQKRPAGLYRGRTNWGGLLIGIALVGTIAALLSLSSGFDGLIGAIVHPDPRYQGSSASPQEPLSLPRPIHDPFNVLLIGVDQRGDDLLEGIRSDTLIVVRVHPQEKWASMLSIPRDSVAPIPHVGVAKINGAYSYGFLNASELYGPGTSPADGGGALAAETVERLLNIRVDYIAQVDFSGFERIIDTLGGITVDVERPLLDPEYPTENYGRERIYVPVGLQVFDGKTALRYARSRHGGSDFERSKRQQQVLQAILKEVQSRGLLNQLDVLLQMFHHLKHSVTTTLPLDDPAVIYGLAQLARSIGMNDVLRLSINPNEVRVAQEVGSDIYWDKHDLALLVKRFQGGPKALVGVVRVLNGAGTYGLATRTTTALQNQGFQVFEPGDAPRLYPRTTLIDYTGLPNMRKAMMDLFGLDVSQVYDTPPPDAPPPTPNVDLILILGQDYANHLIE